MAIIDNNNVSVDPFNPEWITNPSPIEWCYYISKDLMDHWHTFTISQQELMCENAIRLARGAMAHHYRHG